MFASRVKVEVFNTEAQQKYHYEGPAHHTLELGQKKVEFFIFFPLLPTNFLCTPLPSSLNLVCHGEPPSSSHFPSFLSRYSKFQFGVCSLEGYTSSNTFTFQLDRILVFLFYSFVDNTYTKFQHG